MTNIKNNEIDLLSLERAIYEQGYTLIAGVDEAGRGPLAGPVVSAAVILPPQEIIHGINDSKKLSPQKREALDLIIREKAIAYAINIADIFIINRINIKEAAILTMEGAISSLAIKPDFILTDFEKIKTDIPQLNVVKGDLKSQSIAAASILAKVMRDKIMVYLHSFYPAYGLDKHKGYGTKFHQEQLKQLGPSPIHREKFTAKYIKSS